ncbi:hypothetical protein HNR46_000836 [Haloferula luteola]|uniref:DUF3592 domain-containing protein n=1 Tax=Haloferula luteola TaxID=595692 RepID=A0A840V789_9BACT|nr:hypothetical protein [Haloferula luteola]
MKKKRSVAARVYLSFVGLALAVLGGVFSWLMWKSFLRAEEVDHWPVVPCSILESEVKSRRDDPDWPPEMPQEFSFHVRYIYEWEGKEWESDHYRLRGASWSSTPAAAEALVEQYPKGSVQDCLVNPEQPRKAVLKGESKAPGYSLWFPLIFVVGGLGITVGAWRR